MIAYLLRVLAKHLPCRRIELDGDLYLERFYFLGAKPRWTDRGWLTFLPAVYLHCFHRPDADRELHNHPWTTSYSLILSGGYDEERAHGDAETDTGWTFWPLRIFDHTYGMGAVNTIKRGTFHRVSELHTPHVWTLFAHGERVGKWGFISRDLQEYRDYSGD